MLPGVITSNTLFQFVNRTTSTCCCRPCRASGAHCSAGQIGALLCGVGQTTVAKLSS